MYCGTEMRKGIKEEMFCPKCGYKPAETQAPTQPQATETPKESNTTWLKLAMIVLAGVALLVLMYM
ncbi:MAG: hypothetical protein R6V53_00215, partial [Candidatus Woesearchaeota archaeon]